MASMNIEMSLISSSNPSNSTRTTSIQSNGSTAVCHIRRSEGEMTLSYYATDAGGPAWYVKNFSTEMVSLFLFILTNPSLIGAPDVLNHGFPTERRANELATRPSPEQAFVTEMLAEEWVPEATLSVSLIDQDSVWVGFIHQHTLYVRASSWTDVDVRESIMAVMELAESLECQNVALCVPKTANQIQPFVHDLLLVGFELIHPQAMQLKHSVQSNYICVGMEL